MTFAFDPKRTLLAGYIHRKVIKTELFADRRVLVRQVNGTDTRSFSKRSFALDSPHDDRAPPGTIINILCGILRGPTWSSQPLEEHGSRPTIRRLRHFDMQSRSA